MNIEAIEELIRRYLSTGIAVVVILVAPGTGDLGPAADTLPSDPSATVLEPEGSASEGRVLPGRPGAGERHAIPPPQPRAQPEPPDDRPVDDGTADRNGAYGSDPGEDPDLGAGTGGSRAPETGRGDTAPADSPGNSDGPDGPDGCDCPDAAEDGTGTDSTGSGDPDIRSAPARPRQHTDADRTDNDRTSTNNPGDPPPTDPGTTATGTGDGTTAAERYGWGIPERVDDFSGGVERWSVYYGPGHAGKGMRSPSAITLEDGILTITGDSSGTTAGMAWNPGQKYGRWEGRVRAPASDPSYNALLLLWPDAENFPEGGEIDFMEMLDPTRQETDLLVHYGADNSQVNGKVQIDGTAWHNWAVEWTPEAITAYVDGEEWYRTTDTSIFPTGPMHLCIQLDWFPGSDTTGESAMQVDWVKQYRLDDAAAGDADETRNGGTSPVREMVRRMFSWR